MIAATAKSSSPDPMATSRTLVNAARCGDSLAWWRLVGRYSSLIFAWARHAGLDDAEASQVLAEVLVAVHRGLRTFQPSLRINAFRNWLWTITRRRIIDAYARRGDAPGMPPAALEGMRDQPVFVRSEDSSRRDRRLEFLGVLCDLEVLRRRFPPHVWTAFWRTTVDELRPSVVGAELGMTPAAVRLAKYHVLASIRESTAPRATPARGALQSRDAAFATA